MAGEMPSFTVPSEDEEPSIVLQPNTSAFDDTPDEVVYTLVPNGTQRGKPIAVGNQG